ncbi:hypothetical protein G9A89_019380 [Geosiphon pyriformis]|nr:hypothetical protein G9A89_019380 [Geosiphon pyriformis]
MVKKTKNSEKWGQSLASAIVTPNLFVVPNKILDKISIASSNMLSKISLDQLLAVLPNMVSFSRLLSVLEAKQFPLVGSPLIHGFLGAKSVSKNNVKLFCVEFASQVFLEAAFLVELTSSVHLATLKIAKSLVISESGSPFAAVALHDVPLSVFAADIKTALSVFSSVSYVVLKSAGIWQYVMVYFEQLDSAVSALNHWSVLAKLINLSSGCTAFEISNMISQIGGWTCFILRSSDSGYCSWFVLITFGSQADLDSAIAKTDHLAADCKISSLLPSKLLKVFTPCFVGLKSYAKASASLGSSGFLPLSPFVSSSVVIDDFLVLSQLFSLESDLVKLFALVKSIVKPVGSLVKLFEQFINGDLVLSSKLGLKINKVMVHMGFFNKVVGKLGREVISLKKKCCIEDIDMSGDLEHPVGLDDKVFSNLMFL